MKLIIVILASLFVFNLQAREEFYFPPEVIINAGAGYLINQQRYPNEYDKKLHSNIGGMISLGTSSATYLLIKDSALDNKSKEQIVRYSGPIASLVVGILKEVAYDRINKSRHTSDREDAIATGIGGGLIPIRFEMTF